MEWREREREMKVRRDLKMNSTPLLRTHACLSSSLLLSSTLHLLSSANVFTLVFPRPPCHSRSPSLFPLCQSPPIGKWIGPWRGQSLHCEKSWEQNFRGRRDTFYFPELKPARSEVSGGCSRVPREWWTSQSWSASLCFGHELIREAALGTANANVLAT